MKSKHHLYRYRQNNSGGHFIVSDSVAETVFIEATSPKEADAKAKSVGIYFDGVETGQDCSCCGDRWSSCSEFDWSKEPFEGDPFEFGRWSSVGEVVIVYYEDGSKRRVVNG
jgi:hypothetical protein